MHQDPSEARKKVDPGSNHGSAGPSIFHGHPLPRTPPAPPHQKGAPTSPPSPRPTAVAPTPVQILHATNLTLEELLQKASPASAPPRTGLCSITERPTLKWDLLTDYDQAFLLAREGWSERAEQLQSLSVDLARTQHTVATTLMDVQGGAVDVGAFLAGEPECMISHSVQNPRMIKFVVHIGASCKVPAEQLFNRGVGIAATILSLQSLGHPVSLTVAEWITTPTKDEILETTIEISRTSEYLNPAKLAFWLAHPAALRRIIFRINEHESPALREKFAISSSGGYGWPVNPPQDRLDEETVFVPWPGDRVLSTPGAGFELIRETLLKQGVALSPLS